MIYMMLSNTATPKYYKKFRDDVIRGKIPVNRYIAMEMHRIDDLIRNPGIYYDDQAVEGWIRFCENELTLTDGSNMNLLDSFKLWGEQLFGWYFFEERSVYQPYQHKPGGHYVTKRIKKRLTKKQYIITVQIVAQKKSTVCLVQTVGVVLFIIKYLMMKSLLVMIQFIMMQNTPAPLVEPQSNMD